MKIIIGPYKNYFGPYQLAEKLMFWVPKKKDELYDDQVEKFGEWLAHGRSTLPTPTGNLLWAKDNRPKTWIYRFLLWVSSKRVQKFKVRIDRWDTWSMDHTLAHIILPMLKQLKETKHGAPSVDNKDVPKELRSDAIEGDVSVTHFKKWDWVMDEMIFAFESKHNDWEEHFQSGEHDIQWIELENGMSEMVKGPNDTYKIDWIGRKAYQKRISNGFRLFGKYFESLWD